jgi:apolipoprotein N-acyltransferase
MGLVQNNFIKWALSGVLLGVGFVVPSLWVVGLVGGFLFLNTMIAEQSLLRLCVGATLAWTIKSAFATSVFWSVYPIEWLPVDFGLVQLLLIFMYWSTASLWLGLGALVVVIGYKVSEKYLTKISTLMPLVLLPLFWVAGEVLGSFIFSVMMIGPGGALNAAYSLGYSGYLLAEHDGLLQMASFGGVYILSFLYITFVVFLLLVLQKKNIVISFSVGLIVSVAYLSSFQQYVFFPVTPKSDGHTIVSIDTYPDRQQSKEQTGFQKSVAIEEAMERALLMDNDYILLPEDAQFFNQTKTAGSLAASINLKYESPDQVIVDSGGAVVDGKLVLQASVFNGPEDAVEVIHKRYLVPQGEFMPTLYSGFLSLFGSPDITKLIKEHLSFEIGPNTNQSAVADNVPGILFCFESVDPRGVRRLVDERGNMPFVAHPISHTWFHDSEILWHQLESMLRVQAVWSKQYIISSSNHAYSSAYAPNGAIQMLEAVESGEGWAVKQIIIPKNN